MSQDDPKPARWANAESDEDVPEMSEEMKSSRESRRHSAFSAKGWSEGPDGLWREEPTDPEWMPKCEVGCVTHAAVRDRASGMAIHDSAGSTHYDNGRLNRAFKTPRNVDMIAEANLAEEPSSQPLSWEETGT